MMHRRAHRNVPFAARSAPCTFADRSGLERESTKQAIPLIARYRTAGTVSYVAAWREVSRLHPSLVPETRPQVTGRGVQSKPSCPYLPVGLRRTPLNHETPILALTHAPLNVTRIPAVQSHLNELVTD
jgi:hypothetical protein